MVNISYEYVNASSNKCRWPVDCGREFGFTRIITANKGGVNLQTNYSKTNDYTISHTNIAFGMGITFRQIGNKLVAWNTSMIIDILSTSPFFKHFMPSLCSTIEKKYRYKIYLAYDFNDIILGNEIYKHLFLKKFDQIIKSEHCSNMPDIMIKTIMCPYTGQPARAQNTAMMSAYNDSNDYYYMVNDDTRFITKNWTSYFIKELYIMNPSNVGVVGPSYTRGNTRIMTYQFVHRTHFEIFGYFMPPYFTDWFGDDWITRVYDKEHSQKLKDVWIEHVSDVGQRYKVRGNSKKAKEVLKKTQGLVSEFINQNAIH